MFSNQDTVYLKVIKLDSKASAGAAIGTIFKVPANRTNQWIRTGLAVLATDYEVANYVEPEPDPTLPKCKENRRYEYALIVIGKYSDSKAAMPVGTLFYAGEARANEWVRSGFAIRATEQDVTNYKRARFGATEKVANNGDRIVYSI